MLIQGPTQTRIIDSKSCLVGFYCCVLAVQQRILQHNRGIAEVDEPTPVAEGDAHDAEAVEIKPRKYE
jgi:hypothetical protein